MTSVLPPDDAGKKFGSADKWFGFGIALVPVGTGLLVASIQPSIWGMSLGSAGIAASAIAVALVIGGFVVWRRNVKQATQATVLVAGTSSPDNVRRAALSDQRDKLEVEKASLQPIIMGNGRHFAIGLIGVPSPAEIKAQGEYQAARKRTEQIDAQIFAINLELRELAQRSPSSVKAKRN